MSVPWAPLGPQQRVFRPHPSGPPVVYAALAGTLIIFAGERLFLRAAGIAHDTKA